MVELERYRRQGIEIRLDGRQSTPKTVANVMTLREESAYMRDPGFDEDGLLKSLDFQSIQPVNRKRHKGPVSHAARSHARPGKRRQSYRRGSGPGTGK